MKEKTGFVSPASRLRGLTVLLVLVLVLLATFTACSTDRASETGSQSDTSTNLKHPAEDSISSGSDSDPADAGDSADYVGLWHASPVMPSGYTQRLALNADASFIWAASQMDGQERTRFCSGTWSVAAGKLILVTTEQIRLEGGHEVPAVASWGSDMVIMDAVIMVSRTADTKEYSLSPVTNDNDVFDRRTLTIDGEQYWELSHSLDREALSADYAEMRSLEGQMWLTSGPDDVMPTITTPNRTVASSQELYDLEREVFDLAVETVGLIKNKDWGALGHMVHPKQGLTFSPYGFVDEPSAVHLGAGDVVALGMDDTVRTWGYFDGSGKPIEMTIDKYYDRFIMSHDFTRAPEIGIDVIIRTTEENNLYVFGNGVSYVEFHQLGSGVDADHTWASLRLVFGWFEGGGSYESGLYLVAIVHDEWTI